MPSSSHHEARELLSRLIRDESEDVIHLPYTKAFDRVWPARENLIQSE
jgi:hypothetical protein